MPIVPLKQKRGRPRKIVIPLSFEILGHRGTVSYMDPPELKAKLGGEEGMGYYDHSKHAIYLSSAIQGTELEQTYLHELCHCILFSAGYGEYSEDENFVDLFSELFYQVLKTQKGNLLK